MVRLDRLTWTAFALALLAGSLASRAQNVTVSIGGTTYTNKGLVGAGRIDHDKKDKTSAAETFGSLSGLALDLRTWQRSSGGLYSGTLYAQPDRGYTKAGVTTNYRPRRHKISLSFSPDTNGSKDQDQLSLTVSESTVYTESSGTALTSFDPSPTASGSRTGFSVALPQATNLKLSLDAEGLVLLPDGSFFVSDEYGPYLYRFSAAGVLLGAIRPPEALIPKRSGADSFSSDSPAGSASPSQPTTGRENNKGLEGLALSADGRTLYALMQSASRQEGGSSGAGLNRYARLLAYDVTTPATPNLSGEWVLPLPTYTDGSNVVQVAEQHELAFLSSTKFLVLATDGLGRGADVTKSLFRKVLIFDLGSGSSAATDIHGTSFDSNSGSIAPNGVLASSVVAATSAVLVDLNDSDQLKKFNLNNSASADSNTLASKWESMVLAPALDSSTPDDFFLLIGNDNDFSTNSGFQDGASYNASPNVDTMILAYRVTLPGVSFVPIITTHPSSRAANPAQAITFTVAATGSPTPTYQWSKNGVALSGATSATYSIVSAQSADAGTYSVVVTNSAGSVTSSSATLTVSNAPVFTTQPTSLTTVASGSTVVLTASATGTPTPTYQWKKDGTNITGQTGTTLLLTSATNASAGNYSVVANNISGNTTSNSAALAVITTTDPGRLTNLSVLTDVTASTPNFTVGTVIGPAGISGTKALVVRAAGPALAAFGVTETLSDPKMDLYAGTNLLDSNNDWGGGSTLTTAMASVGAFAYPSTDSKDAAIYRASMSPGDHSVIVSGIGGTLGTAIAEIYDATSAGSYTPSSPRLTNVSVLKRLSASGSITLGFTVGGSTAKTLLIRAIGPGLIPIIGSGTLSDPQMTLYSIVAGVGSVIATNDNWAGNAALLSTMARVTPAFLITNTSSADAMLLLTLAPGSYTAKASNVDGTSGYVIVEVYDVP